MRWRWAQRQTVGEERRKDGIKKIHCLLWSISTVGLMGFIQFFSYHPNTINNR